MKDLVRLGFLGVAHFHADSYARVAKKLSNVEIAGVYDHSPGLASHFAENFGLRRYGGPEQLLKDVDAVVIASENVLHHEYVLQAAEMGKHILCEKPMAVSLKQADEIVKTVEKTGIKFQMCYVMRYHTVSALVKELLADGRIGKLLAMNGTNKLNRALPLLRQWFTDRNMSGGGAVMDHTVHLSDLMRWYAGSEIAEVYTVIGRNVNPEIEVEDSFLTTVRMENGVIGSIDGSWTYASGHYTWGDVTMELVGSEGVLSMDAFRQNIHYTGSDKLSWHYYGCDPDMLMVEDFIRCIREDTRPKAGAYDGRQGVAVTIAGYESSLLGKPVKPG